MWFSVACCTHTFAPTMCFIYWDNDVHQCDNCLRDTHLILHWIKIEAQDRALRASSQEICQWTVRSWSLSYPSGKKYKEWGKNYPLRLCQEQLDTLALQKCILYACYLIMISLQCSLTYASGYNFAFLSVKWDKHRTDTINLLLSSKKWNYNEINV